MNRLEHYLTIAIEECNETAQRISKALRFGLAQIQEDANDKPEENPERLDNKQRIVRELHDLLAMLDEAGVIDIVRFPRTRMAACLALEPKWLHAKKVKVERYLERSRQQGTLADEFAFDADTFEQLALMGRTLDGRFILGPGAAERVFDQAKKLVAIQHLSPSVEEAKKELWEEMSRWQRAEANDQDVEDDLRTYAVAIRAAYAREIEEPSVMGAGLEGGLSAAPAPVFETLLRNELDATCDADPSGFPCPTCGKSSILHAFKRVLARDGK